MRTYGSWSVMLGFSWTFWSDNRFYLFCIAYMWAQWSTMGSLSDPIGPSCWCVETVAARVPGIKLNSGQESTGQLWKILERTGGLFFLLFAAKAEMPLQQKWPDIHQGARSRELTAGTEGQTNTRPENSGSLFHTPATPWSTRRGTKDLHYFLPG